MGSTANYHKQHPSKISFEVGYTFSLVRQKSVVFLPMDKTVNLNMNCDQLDKLKTVIYWKHPAFANHKSIIFHHDYSRLHILQTQKELLGLGWEVVPHSPYSFSPAPSDFHRFWSLQNSLNRQTLNYKDEVKIHLEEFNQ